MKSIGNGRVCTRFATRLSVRRTFFEHIYLSYEMKMAKPDADIFQKVLDETGILPNETLFIDDSEPIAGQRRRWVFLPIRQRPTRIGDMQLFCETSDIGSRPSVATIGFFDGVHRGHRYLIEQVCAVAAGRGLASSVVTFPVHPRKVMQADYHPKLLTTCDEKVSLLAKTGWIIA